jgi:hypothetical protein
MFVIEWQHGSRTKGSSAEETYFPRKKIAYGTIERLMFDRHNRHIAQLLNYGTSATDTVPVRGTTDTVQLRFSPAMVSV